MLATFIGSWKPPLIVDCSLQTLKIDINRFTRYSGVTPGYKASEGDFGRAPAVYAALLSMQLANLKKTNVDTA